MYTMESGLNLLGFLALMMLISIVKESEDHDSLRDPTELMGELSLDENSEVGKSTVGVR